MVVQAISKVQKFVSAKVRSMLIVGLQASQNFQLSVCLHRTDLIRQEAQNERREDGKIQNFINNIDEKTT